MRELHRVTAAVIGCIVAVMVVIAGCHQSTQPGSTQQQHPMDSTVQYTLMLNHLPPLDSTRQYALWFKFAGDTTWSFGAPLGLYNFTFDSLMYFGTIKLPHSADSIARVVLSLDPAHATAPAAKLIAGDYSAFDSSDVLSATDPDGIGDLSAASGVVTFSTTSADTNRAKSSYYLMKLVNGLPVSGVQSLPAPRQGWTYGLWVLDSNFFPMHQFFYGSFTSPNGYDSDHKSDEFPYPGGYKPASLTDPGGEIYVTLEPTFVLGPNGVPMSGPSPFSVFWVPLQRWINFDQTLTLTNVANQTVPGGTLRFKAQ